MTDNNGCSALDYARALNVNEIIQLLESAAASQVSDEAGHQKILKTSELARL